MRHLAAALVAVALGGPAASAGPRQASANLIRLHVFAAEADRGRPVDREAQARADSAGDLREALADGTERRELIGLVDDRGQADVVIEVLRREQQMTRRAGTPGNLGSRRMEPGGPTTRRVFVRVSVPAVDHEEEIEGVDASSWRGAADDAAATIEAWIRTNLDALRSTRR